LSAEFEFPAADVKSKFLSVSGKIVLIKMRLMPKPRHYLSIGCFPTMDSPLLPGPWAGRLAASTWTGHLSTKEALIPQRTTTTKTAPKKLC